MSTTLFTELNGKRGIVTLTHGGDDLALAVEFAATFARFSLAQIDYVSASHGTMTALNAHPPGAAIGGPYANIGLYALVFLRDSRDGKPYGIKVVAPRDFLFDDGQEVTPDHGAELAVAYSELAGRAFTFMHGQVKGRA